MNHQPDQETIAVIDDDDVIRISCRKILSKAGHKVETFEDGAAGIEGVARLNPALVVVDLMMPRISGMEVIPKVLEIDPDIIIVVITGYATIGTAVEAMKKGAYDFLPKPFSPEELRLIVRRGLERRRLAQEARRAEMEREMLKRRFVSFVSHQMKTPLVAINQYLQVMKHLGEGAQASTERDEWIDRCIERSSEMMSIIEDWLTLSKVESGALAVHKERLDLKPLIKNVTEAYEAVAANRGVSLRLELPEEEYTVLADRTCMSVLLDNLITNAIKYNKQDGSVSVSGRRLADAVEISVEDTGIGISEEDQKRLFEEFFRASGSGAEQASGTGLGLAICQKILKEMGGEIEVKSELGQGSVFTVRVPVPSEEG